MKKNSLILLTGAIVLASGSALLARALLAPPKPPEVKAQVQPVASKEVTRQVLVASRNLQPGDFIDAGSLDWQPATAQMTRSLYFIEGQDKQDSLLGATVRQPVEAGQPLTSSVVVRPGEPGFLASVIQPGMRAVSVPTSAVESNFGLVAAGDRVDVILSLKREQETQAPDATTNAAPFLAAQTILHDVRVLAMNNSTRSDLNVRRDLEATPNAKSTTSRQSFETVTLEVAPAAAEQLAVAKEIGNLQLAIRSSVEQTDDELLTSGEVTTLNKTTSIYPAPKSVSRSGPATTVQVFRGKSTEVLDLAKH
ncbi:Flp pilus assembly protein CpaB [Pseudomonas lijiangensis]|uniref:Flp pilus assembly protein CpaB n=1 Tax=Pseudomonas lijiangensis TaxID=2995658 RepID=UPI0031B9E0E5